MARTITSLVQGITRKAYRFVSPGKLFAEAEDLGYEGTQEALNTRANDLVARGKVIARVRGMGRVTWYCHPSYEEHA